MFTFLQNDGILLCGSGGGGLGVVCKLGTSHDMTAKQKLWTFYGAVPLSHFSFPLIVAVLSDFSQGQFEVLPAEKDTTPHKEIFKNLHFKRRGYGHLFDSRWKLIKGNIMHIWKLCKHYVDGDDVVQSLLLTLSNFKFYSLFQTLYYTLLCPKPKENKIVKKG